MGIEHVRPEKGLETAVGNRSGHHAGVLDLLRLL
jgi:hypothetical protein